MLYVIELQDEEPKYKVNLSNRYIHSYLSSNPDDSEILKEQIKTSMGLLGLVLHSKCKKLEESTEDFKGTQAYIKDYSKQLAPVLMFLIRDIGKLGL